MIRKRGIQSANSNTLSLGGCGPMRTKKLLLLCLLAPISALAAQQDAPKPKKVLTPEQQTYQQELKQFRDELERLRTVAKQAFDAEMARDKASEKAGDCPDANTTTDMEICLGREGKTTDGNYKMYAGAIRSMLGLKEPIFPGSDEEQPQTGPAGPILTSDQLVAEFDNTEHLWESYRDAQCTAAFHQFEGGTGGPSAEAQCELTLTRRHMRDLDDVYDMMLNH